jgi:hypothetical protein
MPRSVVTVATATGLFVGGRDDRPSLLVLLRAWLILPPLATDSVGRAVDGEWLVRDVSIEVREQDAFVVFGPSGGR